MDIGLSVNINHSGDKKALSYDVDMTSFEKGIKAISENCRPDVLILIETTVPPGTSQNCLSNFIGWS